MIKIPPIIKQVQQGTIGERIVVRFWETVENELGEEEQRLLNISDATRLHMIFGFENDPQGESTFTVTAEFYTDGTDGKIKYMSQAGDLVLLGLCYVQGYYENAEGEYRSSIASFKIVPNIANAEIPS
jgi:hypothetical protein